MADIEVVDPKGDILLCFAKDDSGAVNPDAPSIQVSSSVLCLASPVFRAMLNGPMAEGLAFRAPDSPRPFPINLPEDHWAFFLQLANILHYRADRITYLPDGAYLHCLLRLVDKYDCAGAVRSQFEVWLQRATANPFVPTPSQNIPERINMTSPAAGADLQQDQGNNEDDDSKYERVMDKYNRLVFVAYVLDMPEHFARLSRDILLNHRQTLKDEIENGVELTIPPEHELLRHDIHGEFTRRKARFRQGIHTALMDPVSRVTSMQYTNYYSPIAQAPADPRAAATQLAQTQGANNPGGGVGVGGPTPPWALQSRPTCPNAARAIGNYMTLLDLENLSPWRPQFETDSFKEIFMRALNLVTRERQNPDFLVQCCGRRPCGCDHMGPAPGQGVHLVELLAGSLGDPFSWPLWVCLDCVKRGGRPEAGTGPGAGGCRIPHW